MPTPNPSAATVEGLAPGWNDRAGHLENEPKMDQHDVHRRLSELVADLPAERQAGVTGGLMAFYGVPSIAELDDAQATDLHRRLTALIQVGLAGPDPEPR